MHVLAFEHVRVSKGISGNEAPSRVNSDAVTVICCFTVAQSTRRISVASTRYSGTSASAVNVQSAAVSGGGGGGFGLGFFGAPAAGTASASASAATAAAWSHLIVTLLSGRTRAPSRPLPTRDYETSGRPGSLWVGGVCEERLDELVAALLRPPEGVRVEPAVADG